MDAHTHSIAAPGFEVDVVRNANDTQPSSGRPSASTARSSESTNRSKTSSSGSHRGSHESKPRLSKDQHERLEREFRLNHKPSTAVKKQFSQQLGISLEKVNNWFQNRRAKVKHEEKKQRNSIPTWPDLGAAGIPLSDSGFINSAFLQTQDSSNSSEAVDYSYPHQSDFSPDGSVPYSATTTTTTTTTTIGDCPTIQEEPTFQDDNSAFMNFLGIQTGSERHVQLQDVNQISQQFHPQSRMVETMSSTPHGPSVYHTPDPPSIAAPYSQNASSTCLVRTQSDEMAPPGPLDPQRSTSSLVQAPGMAPDGPIFTRGWSFTAPPQQHQGAQFDLKQAKEMVHQLQAQTSQETQPEQHAFGYPTSQTHVANPQPLIPSQPSFHEPLPIAAPPANTSVQQEVEQQHVPEEFKGPVRTDSGTSLLADNMNDVDIASTRHIPMRPPSTSSLSLAQRRQKRPANISAAAPRSYSSSQAPLSASDRNMYQPGPSEAHLRRIKSSSGVLNGRIQKSGQRSPLHQWSFAEGHQHLSRQLSTSSLNAALKNEEQVGLGQAPLGPPQQPAMHVHNQSNSSALSHLTIPEDNAQSADSVWSAMPGTADTANTSVYHSLPPTAHTAKSYASPPHSPMDHAQIAAMQIHQNGMRHHVPQAFQNFQPQPDTQSFAPTSHVSPHEARNEVHPQVSQPGFSTEELLMNSIPIGHPPATHQHSEGLHRVQSQPLPVAHSTVPIMDGHAGFVVDHQQPQPHWMMPGQQQGPVFHHMEHHADHPELTQQNSQHQFSWNVHPDEVQEETEQPNGDLQIHQFTPSNPVDPSNLPPKQKSASPRQNYSFQNFGPDYYSSPKSQSSQSKASSPGHLLIPG